MFSGLREAWLERDRSKLAEVQRKDDQVDVLEGEILRYLSAVRKQEFTDNESDQLALSMKAADLFQSIGDVVETERVNLSYRALYQDIEAS